jgi:hypothetical protein
MSLTARIFRLTNVCLLAAACLAQSQPAVPERLPLSLTSRPAEPAAGIESPTLYELLKQFRPTPLPAESQGIPYDRKSLLARPQHFVGELVTTQAQYIETEPIPLYNAPAGQPAFVWSTLAIDPDRNPIQVLSLGPRPDLDRLARVRCVGYFYEVRADRAAAPDRTGNIPSVRVPVFVGWVVPAAGVLERPSLPAAPWQMFGLAVAAAMVLFFVLFVFVRRREDWRARVSRRHRRSTSWPDQTDGP